ncbi:MAG: DUF1801 domain-containing protein [Pseudomonadota bacterium]|nr:DUF1801 domain-containing protein [Pseudomonadota bacterium]
MKRSGPLPASPDEYFQSIGGWQRDRVEMLRAIARKVGESEETVKWGHLVYMANGPAFLIRADDERVLFGFWRGKRLLDIEPRMTGTGKYEMKTLELREDTNVDPAVAQQLVREAIKLNRTIGNPTERR